MQIKEVKPINFLYFRKESRMSDLGNFLPLGQELYREAVKQNLKITGPVHWHYFGFNGDESKFFTLEVALPVGDLLKDYDGKFHFKRTDSFKCVSSMHEGNWFDIPKCYGKLMEFINANKLTSVAVNREIYINTDFNNPEANATEIQIGIQ